MRAVAEIDVPSGTGCAVELEPGQLLRIETPHGDQGGDLGFADFDQALTRNVNGWDRFGAPRLVFHVGEGMRLVDGDGETVMTVGPARGVTTTDVMLPGCWRELYADGRPGCRDIVARHLGIERAGLKGMLSFFTACAVDADAYDGLRGAQLEPGDYVSFRAVRPVRVAVSACPDLAVPGWREGPLRVVVLPKERGSP